MEVTIKAYCNAVKGVTSPVLSLHKLLRAFDSDRACHFLKDHTIISGTFSRTRHVEAYRLVRAKVWHHRRNLEVCDGLCRTPILETQVPFQFFIQDNLYVVNKQLGPQAILAIFGPCAGFCKHLLGDQELPLRSKSQEQGSCFMKTS